MDVHFGDNSYYKLERQDGLFHITLRAVYAGSPANGTKLDLILDTGAYMTVISRSTANRCGFDKLPKTTLSFTGFGGKVKADFVKIPGLLILGKLKTDVPVIIPHDYFHVDEDTGEKKPMQEVLGLNVLEYYNYFIDTENDKLYLQDNPSPRFYDPVLESGPAFTAKKD